MALSIRRHGERSTSTPTPCRCRCWHVWPTAGSRTSTACPTGSSGWTPGSAAWARGRRCPWRAVQYDVAVRLSEMDGAGVDRHAVSLPPFLFASTSDDGQFVSGRRAAGQRRAGRVRRRRAGPPARAGFGAARLARTRRRRPGAASTSSGWRASRSAAAAAVATSTTRSTASCGRCSPSAGRSSSCTPAASRTRSGSATGTCRSSSGTRPRPRSRSPAWCSAARWSATRSTCAWPTAAAACRRCAGGWTWAGSARRSPGRRRCRRARTPTGCTTTPRCSTRRCCAGWSRTWAPST